MERKTLIPLSFPVLLALCILLLGCDERPIERIWGLRRISFHSNGGSSVSSQNVLRGEKIRRPRDPTKPNYMFEAWYEDNETFLYAWDFDIPPAGDMTLYAGWRYYGLLLSHLEDVDLGWAEIGFTTTAAVIKYLKNTTDEDIQVAISFSGGNNTAFNVDNNLFLLAPGQEIDLTFSHLPNLQIGVYSETVTISGGGHSIGFGLRFEVTHGTVIGMSLVSPPNRLLYIEGENLDLSGLAVNLIYSSGYDEEVNLSQFTTRRIATNIANGTVLLYPGHDGVVIEVYYIDNPLIYVNAGTLTVLENIGAVTITLDIDQITDPIDVNAPTDLSRSGLNGPNSAQYSVTNPEQYTSIRWEIAGAGVNAGTTILLETGAAVTVYATNPIYISGGGHTLMLTVVYNNQTYMKNIFFTVVD